MITTLMWIGLVIFAMISNVYCLWCNIAERRKMEQKEQELKRCKMELKVTLRD